MAAARRDIEAMNIRQPRTRRFGAFAAAVGPREVAALALTVPSLETSELARILLSAVPVDERNQP